MEKRSQIQMGETIAVLFVFFILIVIGFMFYTKVIKGSIESDREEISQFKSIGIVQRAMSLPELQCSEGNIVVDNCIDLLKLRAAKDMMKENEIYYYDLLEFSDVNVTKVYPDMEKWNVYQRPADDISARFITNVPVSLYDPITKRFGFGILSVETRLK